MFEFIGRVLKRKKAKPEKIRIRIKDGRVVLAYCPTHIANDRIMYAMYQQQLHAYVYTLNGNPFSAGGLGLRTLPFYPLSPS